MSTGARPLDKYVRLELGALLAVRIVQHAPAPRDGLIGSAAPLAQALLGAVVGDEVPFHVPGGVRKTLRLKEIRRSTAGGSLTPLAGTWRRADA